MSLHGNPAERGHSHKFLTGSFTPGGLSNLLPPRPGYHADRKAVNKIDFLSKHVIGKSFMSHNGADGADQKHEIGLFLLANGVHRCQETHQSLRQAVAAPDF